MLDALWILVLLALAFPVIAIVALVIALSARGDVARLGMRLQALERDGALRDSALRDSAWRDSTSTAGSCGCSMM